MNRRTLLGAALLATATGAATMGTARAATQAPYDAKSFAAAQNANKPKNVSGSTLISNTPIS